MRRLISMSAVSAEGHQQSDIRNCAALLGGFADRQAVEGEHLLACMCAAHLAGSLSLASKHLLYSFPRDCWQQDHFML